ncbi:MAG: HEAT repeat domain-containing protein, partial [Planctomycetaceae bacterium]
LRESVESRKALGHPPALEDETAMLRALWGEESSHDELRDLFLNAKVDGETRIAALRTLIAVNDESVLAAVDEFFSQSDRKLRAEVLATLGNVSSPEAADVLLKHYGTFDPNVRPKAVEVLTQRAAWAKKLLAAIAAKQIPKDALNLNQARRLLALGDDELTALVTETWGTIREGRNPQREQVIAEMRKLIRNSEGDPRNGQQVYVKVCGQCHKIYGEGNEVGPDITRNGRGSFEQLLSNVFDPSLVIGAGYRSHTLVTADGRVLNGLVVEDGPQRIVLKVQGGKLETIPRGEIEIFKESEISMMPEQLETQLKPQEMADLFAFLMLDRPPSDPEARPLPETGGE